jgi:hypothetical protein
MIRNRTARAVFELPFSVILLLFFAPAWAQLSTPPSLECHVTDGSFTPCPSGAQEWSDVTPASFPASDSYLYVNQDATHTNLYLMYDLPYRTVPLAATDSVHINFNTVEQVSGAPKLIVYDIYIYGSGQVQILQQGKPTPAGNIVAAAGFGPSPNSLIPHVTAELQVPLVAGPPSTYSSDPLSWSTTLPPTPPPPPDPPSCPESPFSVCIKSQDQIDAWNQEAAAANAEGDLIMTIGEQDCDVTSSAAASAASQHADAILASATANMEAEAAALQTALQALQKAANVAKAAPTVLGGIQQGLNNLVDIDTLLSDLSEEIGIGPGGLPPTASDLLYKITLASASVNATLTTGEVAAAAAAIPELSLALAATVGAYNIYQASLVIETQALAAAAQDAVELACIIPVAAAAAIDYAKAVAYQVLADDPPDPNYMLVATPTVPSVLEQPFTTATGFSPQVTNDLNSLISNGEQEIALLQVIPTSVNRVAGAVAAGDASWQATQANAVQTYASELIPLVNNETSLKAALANDLSASGLVFTFDAGAVFGALGGPSPQTGLPSAVQSALSQLGVDGPTQNAILNNLISTAPTAVASLGTGVAPNALTDASLTAAANAAVNALTVLATAQPAATMTPSLTVTIAGDYTTAGVGLRGATGGTINLSGVPAGATIQKAFLYWGMLDNGEDSTLKQMTINSSAIVGTRIGTGPDTCWGRTNSFTYRADVTPFVTGNGTYALTNVASGGNILAEGASLIVVYQLTGAPVKTVIIDDGNIAIPFGTPTGTAAFNFAATAPVKAATTFNVGDGQAAQFNSPTPTSFTGDAGTISFPNLFNSLDGPLWDTSTFDVSSVITAGPDTGTATITVSGDCLLWSAQAFSVTSTPVTATPITATAGVVVASPTGGTVVNLRGLGPSDLPTLTDQIGMVVQFRAIENPLISPATLASQLVTGLVNDGVLSNSQKSAIQQAVLKNVVTPSTSNPQICDVNGDGQIDKQDISLITSVLNTPAAGPTDTRDANKDGIINALDARICVTKCTYAGCAVN